MPYKDPEKQKSYKKAYNKRYYEKNKDRQKERVQARKKRLVAEFIEYRKTLSCEKCGETRHYLLRFHHINGIQDGEDRISSMAHLGYSLEHIKKEAQEKCKVLCANCHIEEHYFSD